MYARLCGRPSQFLVCCTLALAIGTAVQAAGQQGAVYLWVDKNGTPHYEDRPNELASSKEMNLRYQLTDQKALASAAQKKTEMTDAAKTRDKQEADDKTKGQSIAQQTADERTANCKAAKERLEKYDAAHKLYKPLPNGERQYLTDQEMDAARAEARKTVDEWCSAK
jgi:hypothetical protein